MKKYSIKEVSKEVGLSEVYIRRMILTGKLPTTKTLISENVWRHEIDETVVEQMKQRIASSSRSNRTDGRNKFVVYLNTKELEELKKLLQVNKLQTVVERANKGKYVSMKNKKLQTTKQ